MIVISAFPDSLQTKKEAALRGQLPYSSHLAEVLPLYRFTFDVEDDDLAEIQFANAGLDL